MQEYQESIARRRRRRTIRTISPRVIYRVTFFSCWLLAPFFVFGLLAVIYFEFTQDERGRTLIALPGSFLLVCPWAARWIACRLAALFVPTILCPGCGFHIDSISRWSVGGYTDHRERHFYIVKSLIDGRFVGHFDCPKCGSTIMLR